MTNENVRSERDKLIEDLNHCLTYKWDGQQNVQELDPRAVIDFILEDRRRIVEPLVNIPEQVLSYVDAPVIQALAISKTLKRAGVRGEKENRL